MYITSQILSAISLLFNFYSRTFKKQCTSLLVNSIANLFGLLSCLFLLAYMGMAGLIISIIRSFVFYYFSKNNLDKKVWLLVLFVALQFASCLTTSLITGFVFIDFALIFVKGALFTYGAWQRNVKVFRWCSIISCWVAVAYYLLYSGYMNAISEFISSMILIVVIIKEKIEQKKTLKNNNKETLQVEEAKVNNDNNS